MLALAEGVTHPFTCDTKLRVDTDEIGAGLDDLGAGDGRIQSSKPGSPPASQEGAVPKLGDGLERQDLQTTTSRGS